MTARDLKAIFQDMFEAKPHITEAVSANRLDPQRVQIRWPPEMAGLPVSVAMGPTPEAIDRSAPVQAVSGAREVTITALPPHARYYFEVTVDGFSPLVVAERRLHLKGAVNFRDLGGYGTVEGRRVRWGRLFRADNLSHLTETDLDVVGMLALRLVCDLRTPEEVAQAPDRLPDNAADRYLALPAVLGRISPSAAFKRIRRGDASWLTEDFMRDGYRRALEAHGREWGLLFSRLADPSQLPAVFHCSAGKDRTGIFAALTLLALGVPAETVIADHQLSNQYITGFQQRIRDRIRRFGIDPDCMAPYLSAPRDAIEAAVEHIADRYGDAAGYLQHRCQVTPELIDGVRAQLLE